MFEQASRMKLRFETGRGYLAVEDLWDLTVEHLDAVYKRLNGLARQAKEESLLDVRSDADKIVDLQIGIVRRIVQVKLAEREAKKLEVANRAKKQKLLEILDEKQNENLRDMSAEELQKMADAL